MAASHCATGLRAANVHRTCSGRKWTWYNDVGVVPCRPSEGAERYRFRSIAEAVVLIRKLAGKHPTHVFSFRGKPITQVSTKAWYAALERPASPISRGTTSGIPGRAGTCRTGHRFMLCRKWGWASTEMVRRYAHLRRPIIWRLLRSASVQAVCRCAERNLRAQLRHSPGN
jgi:hypothetical protein